MTDLHTRTFMTDSSEAVLLPAEVAFGPDVELAVERRGDVVTLRPLAASAAHDDLENSRPNAALVAALRSLSNPSRPGRRAIFVAPRRG